MEEIKEPYDECHPGQAITAELANQLQITVRNDIAKQVGAVQDALDEYIETPVDAAAFDGKTADEWKKELDGRYAHRDHDHEDVRRYRRYFLELETVISASIGKVTIRRLQPAVIDHGMGRHPVVQVYQLGDLPIPPGRLGTRQQYQLCFCGPPHHNDPEAAEFKTKSWDERHWGDRIDDKMIEDLARELAPKDQDAFKKKFKDDFTLNVWLSNLEEAFFEPGPGQYHFDMGDVYRTQWVRDRQAKTVKELKQQGEWPARFVYRPRLIIDRFREEDTEAAAAFAGLPVEVFHLNLNEIEIAPITDQEMYLMVILRS